MVKIKNLMLKFLELGQVFSSMLRALEQTRRICKALMTEVATIYKTAIFKI